MNKQEIINQVHEFVKKESEGKREDDIFTNHVLSVVNFSQKLADKYNADKFIVTIAAYLHDIHLIQVWENKDHEIKGSEFARDYLKKFNLEQEEIEAISKCILKHRGSKKRKRETKEEKIVACADAMDHIDRCLHMFYRFSKEKGYEEGIEFMRAKLQRGYNKLELDEAKKMIQDKYNAARVLFEF